MSFWADYVIAKQQQGVDASVSLGKIEAKYGKEFRDTIEAELGGEVNGDNNSMA